MCWKILRNTDTFPGESSSSRTLSRFSNWFVTLKVKMTFCDEVSAYLHCLRILYHDNVRSCFPRLL